MSIVVCDNCDKYIDSDIDCDCFVQVGGSDAVLCERCRDWILQDEADVDLDKQITWGVG